MKEQLAEGSTAVTTIIKHHLMPQHIPAYEDWLKEIMPAAQSFIGHQGVNVIRPAHGSTEYTVILHFDTEPNLMQWLQSDVRKELIAQVEPLLIQSEKVEIKTGLEFWFTPQAQKAASPYKQYLVTLSAIFPLTIFVPFLTNTFLSAPDMPHILKILVNDSIVVALMVFIIMPRYVRLVSRWLFR